MLKQMMNEHESVLTTKEEQDLQARVKQYWKRYGGILGVQTSETITVEAKPVNWTYRAMIAYTYNTEKHSIDGIACFYINKVFGFLIREYPGDGDQCLQHYVVHELAHVKQVEYHGLTHGERTPRMVASILTGVSYVDVERCMRRLKRDVSYIV